MIYSGVFEAIGNGRNSLIISLLRQFVITIPLSFILTRFFGPITAILCRFHRRFLDG